MIIVEGSDLVGKTTLCQALLAKDSRLTYKHYTKPPANFHRFFGYLPDMKANMLLDRFFMSEPVYRYAEATNKVPAENRMEPAWTIALCREAINVGSLTIVLTADEELIRQRFLLTQLEGRKEMYDLNAILKANELFHHIAEHGHIGAYTFHVDLWRHLTVESDTLLNSEIEGIRDLHEITCTRGAFMRSSREFPVPAKA